MQIDFDREDILMEARRRVVRRRDVGRVFEQEPAVCEQLTECLDLAFRCVQTLAKPAAAAIEVDAEEIVRELMLGDEPLLMTPKLDPEMAGKATARLYLVTCGLDSREAMRWLNNDYTAYHFQDEIARELVFALGRHAHRSVCAHYPGYRFVRHAIRTETVSSCGIVAGSGGTVRQWDPRRVGRLLQRFGSDALGVSTTSAGCLTPLHSLLGLMTGTPLGENAQVTFLGQAASEPALA